jgi:hypothetical protein
VTPTFTFVVMALASYRLFRLIGLDVITERPRRWVTRRLLPGKSEAFVTCSWCAGAHVSAGVVAVTAQLVSVPLPVLQWLAVSSVVGLVGANLDE